MGRPRHTRILQSRSAPLYHSHGTRSQSKRQTTDSIASALQVTDWQNLALDREAWKMFIRRATKLPVPYMAWKQQRKDTRKATRRGCRRRPPKAPKRGPLEPPRRVGPQLPPPPSTNHFPRGGGTRGVRTKLWHPPQTRMPDQYDECCWYHPRAMPEMVNTVLKS